MAIKLKNQRTTIQAEKSIEMIRKLLIGFGVRDIAESRNDSGKLVAFRFILEVDGLKLPSQLAVNVTAVFLWLKKQKPQPRQVVRPTDRDDLVLEQAEKIAWKNAYEWLFHQLNQIELGQMEKVEAFMSNFYNYNTGQTFYQSMKALEFKPILMLGQCINYRSSPVRRKKAIGLSSWESFSMPSCGMSADRKGNGTQGKWPRRWWEQTLFSLPGRRLKWT